jgi:hypothetical protein
MPQNHWRVWGFAVGGVVLAGILLAWARSQHVHTGSGEPAPTNGGKGPPTRQEFEAAVVGLTGTEVRQKLGDPEKVTGAGVVLVPGDPSEGGWRYPAATRNANAGTIDRGAWLWMARGRVSHVTYDP